MADEEPVDTAPVLDSLDPQQGMVGANDITVNINGSGFLPESVMLWNGADDGMQYVSDTLCTTVIKLSMTSNPSECTLAVRNGEAVSNALSFYITEDITPPPEPKPEESESPNTNAIPAEYMAPDPPDVYQQVALPESQRTS